MLGGIEAGGTKLVLALAESPTRIVRTTHVPTTTPAAAQTAIQVFFGDPGGRPQAIGVGTFGPVRLAADHPRHGRIVNTPKPGWSDFDWRTVLTPIVGKRAAIDTDVGAAALAEGAHGAARGCRDLAYVTVGTGIGAGIVSGGRLVHGALHPEFGHVRVRRIAGDAFAGSCPAHGDCLEGLASGTAIAQATGRPAADVPLTDPAWDRVANALGEAMALLTLTTMPERIVLGGGVMQRGEPLLERIRRATGDALGDYLPDGPTNDLDTFLVLPGLGDRAGIVGALMLAERALTR